MKRLLFFFFASLLPLAMWADDFTATNVDGYEFGYTIVDGSNYGFEYACELSSVNDYDIEALTIPSTVENGGTTYTVIGIKEELDYNDSAIENIVFPDNLIYIGSWTFTMNESLLSVELPNTIQSIGEYAFDGCESLAYISIAATAVAGANELIIGQYAFEDCAPTYLYLGATVNYIGEKAFDTSWDELKEVYCMNPEPPVCDGHNIFNGETYEGTLYVPAGSEEAYADATNWSRFIEDGGKIVGISDSSDTNEITISSAGYATYYIEDAYIMPEGVTGTTITGKETTLGDDGGYILDMTWGYDSGSTVPAGTALLLKGSEGEYEYTITSAGEIAPTDNLLLGSTEYVEETCGPDGETTGYYFYKLTYGEEDGEHADVFGFYWGAEDGAAFASPANKAWLAVPASQASNIKFFSLDGEGDTTGISTVESAEGTSSDAIYTIQGVRVNDMTQRGIYIVNGKKTLVK